MFEPKLNGRHYLTGKISALKTSYELAVQMGFIEEELAATPKHEKMRSYFRKLRAGIE
jgi:hypothetical protein